jgi:hypothetical protein
VPTQPATGPDPIYISQHEDGETVYDWRTVLANVTHAERDKQGNVTLYNYADLLMTLKPDASAALWKFTEEYRAYAASMGGYR